MFTFFIWPFYIYAHWVVFITVTSAAAEILHIKHILCQLDDYSYIFFLPKQSQNISIRHGLTDTASEEQSSEINTENMNRFSTQSCRNEPQTLQSWAQTILISKIFPCEISRRKTLAQK